MNYQTRVWEAEREQHRRAMAKWRREREEYLEADRDWWLSSGPQGAD